MSGQASKDIEQRRYNLERDLISARADLDRNIGDIAKLKNTVEQERSISKMERVRNQRLEELLAEHRRATLDMEMNRSSNLGASNLGASQLDKSGLGTSVSGLGASQMDVLNKSQMEQTMGQVGGRPE